MMLRLAFAVSTALTPDILLMDEMIGVGDAQFIQRAHDRLEKLMNGVEILVLASHNENILRSFCDKAIVMSEGRVSFTGSVDESLAFHADQFLSANSASAGGS
jgi:ABC-type polysaccharide/polyol phosphate transport system ATPase subunit